MALLPESECKVKAFFSFHQIFSQLFYVVKHVFGGIGRIGLIGRIGIYVTMRGLRFLKFFKERQGTVSMAVIAYPLRLRGKSKGKTR